MVIGGKLRIAAQAVGSQAESRGSEEWHLQLARVSTRRVASG